MRRLKGLFETSQPILFWKSFQRLAIIFFFYSARHSEKIQGRRIVQTQAILEIVPAPWLSSRLMMLISAGMAFYWLNCYFCYFSTGFIFVELLLAVTVWKWRTSWEVLGTSCFDKKEGETCLLISSDRKQQQANKQTTIEGQQQTNNNNRQQQTNNRKQQQSAKRQFWTWNKYSWHHLNI